MNALLLGSRERLIGQLVEEAAEHGMKVLLRAGGGEFAGDREHGCILPVAEAPTFEAFRPKLRRL